MARLYANENFPLQVVEELRLLGHDVLTVQETGQAGRRIPDDDVLSYAVAQTRAIVTLNRRHFIRLHQQRPNHMGIVVSTFDPQFVALAHRIHDAICGHDSLSGRLLRISRPQGKR